MNDFLNSVSKRTLIYSCTLFLLLRWMFVLIYNPTFQVIEDFNIAAHLAKGLGFAYGGFENDYYLTALKAPIYPLFLTPFIFFFGASSPMVLSMVQHTLISFSPLLMWQLGKKLKEENLGKIAALLFLFHPSYFYYPTVIEVTNLFLPLAIGWCILFLDAVCYKPSRVNQILLGMYSGVVSLTQPIAILPIVVLLFWGWKSQLKSFAIIFLMLLFPIAIWTLRNYSVFEKVIPMKSAFWMNFYAGWLPENTSDKKFNVINPQTISRLDSLKHKLSDVQMEPIYREAFLSAVTEHPGLYLEKTCTQALQYWWVPTRYLANDSPQFIFVRVMPVIVLNILTLIGIGWIWKHNRSLSISIILVLLYFTLIYAVTHTSNIRFKLDVEWLQLYVIAAIFLPRST